MPMYRVNMANVLDEATGEPLPGLVGQQVRIVDRDTTDPHPIFDAAEDPITGSLLTVTDLFTTPAFYVDTETPATVFLDWLDESSGARGPVPFDRSLRAEAQAAREAADDAAASAASLATGVVRSIDGQVPDENGALDGVVGGSGSSFLLLDDTSPVPAGTPSFTLIARAASAPPSTDMTVADATATTFTAASGSTVELALPTGISDGDLLVAVVTTQNNSSTWTPPAGWVLLQQLDTSNSDFRTTNIYGLDATANPPTGVQAFGCNTSGRIAGAMFRVTGADAASPVQVNGAVGSRPADIYTVPALVGAGGGLVLSVTTGQQGSGDGDPHPLAYSNGLVPFVSIITAASGTGAKTFLDIAWDTPPADFAEHTVQVANTPNAAFGSQVLAIASDG
ncbi:hypothetical protein GCM10027059_50900 [Myceligenerans halotolerans]